MPGKHSARRTPGAARLAAGGALLVAVLLVGFAWPDGGAEPATMLLVRPSAEVATPPGPPPADAAESTAAGPARSDSTAPTTATRPGASATRAVVRRSPSPAAPQPSPPTGTSAAPVSPTPAAARLTARYAGTSSWRDGFVAGVVVSNPGEAAQRWKVVLSYPASVRFTVTGHWNATPVVAGNSLIFEGGPLAPGASHTFGFQAEKRTPGEARPTGCTVNGVACAGF